MDPVPKKKPITREKFEEKVDLYMQGLFGGMGKELMLPLLNKVYQEAKDAGVVTPEEAYKYAQDKSNYYKDLNMRQQMRAPFAKGTEPKTSPVKTDIYKYPVGNKFGTRYAKEPRGNQYTKKSGISLQTDEYKNKIAKEIKDNFLRYNDIKEKYGKKTADIFKGKYPKVGKNPSKEGKKAAEVKRNNWIKKQSSVSMLQKLSGTKGRGGVQLSHLFSKNVPDSLKTLGYLPSEKNIKGYSKFEKPLEKAKDKVYKELNKKKTNAEALLKAFKDYQKQDRKLTEKFPEYKDTKSRLSFKRTAFEPGIMIKEKLRNPNLAISQEPGTQLRGVMPSSEKGKGILQIAKNVLKGARVGGGGLNDFVKQASLGPDLINLDEIKRKVYDKR